MMPDLTSLMVWAATYFIHSTLLLGGVWLWFRQREPSSHAFREAVWKLAAVGGIVTASLQLGLGVHSPLNTAASALWNTREHDVGPAVLIGPRRMPSTTLISDSVQRDGPTDIIRDAEADSAAGAELVWRDDSAETARPEMTLDVAAIGTAATAGMQLATLDRAAMPLPAKAESSSVPWQIAIKGLLAAVCGAIVTLSGWGLVRLLTEQWEFRRRLKTCRFVSTGRAHRLLQQLMHEAGVRRSVRLLIDEDELEPGAWGWIRWQIVLPARAMEELSEPELRGLLAHELAHLVRHDQWWLLLGRLLAVCLGWQPFNRIALREWQRASEYLCDAWAIQRQVPRLSLARCLTTIAEWRLVGLATVAGLGSGQASNLSRRVERLVDDGSLNDPWQRFGRRHLLSAASGLIAFTMVSLAPAATLPDSSPVKVDEHVAAIGQGPSYSPTIQQPARKSNGTAADSLAVVQRVGSIADAEGGYLELIATRIETVPQGDLATIDLLTSLQREVADDIRELSREMETFQLEFSRLPGNAQRQTIGQRFPRLERRMETIRRLRRVLLVPL